MTDETQDPKRLLEDAIRKRDELNTFIKVYQEMLGGGEAPKPDAPANGRADSVGDFSGDPLSAVFPGMFYSQSQPKAVEMFLEKVKPRPQKTKVILQALEKGGAKVGGKNPTVNLWGVLNRNKDTFVLVPKAGWGLTTWYDAAVLAKLRRGQESAEGEDAKDANQG